MKQQFIEIGSGQWVEIDKLYGPAVFQNVRIKADAGGWEWVVEQWVQDDENGLTGHWQERTRFEAELDSVVGDDD